MKQKSNSSKKISGLNSRRLRLVSYMYYKRTQRYLPPVVRGAIGVLLIACGLLGILPVLGFWMIPLGLGVLATDIPPLGRWFRRRMSSRRG